MKITIEIPDDGLAASTLADILKGLKKTRGLADLVVTGSYSHLTILSADAVEQA